ncbi:MAG: hypothetical protein CR988_02395 [Treponema sp.]|nr:MAG: hypothetical protein CR988_02395 [Treponema sp.]
MGKTEYGYSIDRMSFVLLNQDGSVPAPDDWDDTNPKTGEVRTHKGGLVGKGGLYDVSTLAGKDLKVSVIYGTKKGEFTFASTAVKKNECTTAEMVKDLNTGLKTLEVQGIKLSAKIFGDFIKITDAETAPDKKLPFFAPIGFRGKIPVMLGIIGWVSSLDGKSFKDDFEKESGKSVDATSGRGVRCSIKDPDTIKGLNLTINLAGSDLALQAMLTGDSYNEETDEYFFENNEAPAFAGRYFVRQFEEGTNTRSSNTKMRVFCFPSCQITPSGIEASEGNISNTELTGSCSENKVSNLPMKYSKGIAISDYRKFVEKGIA